MTPDTEKKKIVHIHLPEDEPFKTTLNAGRHQFTADEPEYVEGGKDQGPDPYDYLLMALGSCTVMTVKMYATRKGWPVQDLFVELRHNKRHAEDCKHCEDQKSKLDYIEIELIAEGDLTTEQLEKLLDVSKKCPVHRTLMSDIQTNHALSVR